MSVVSVSELCSEKWRERRRVLANSAERLKMSPQPNCCVYRANASKKSHEATARNCTDYNAADRLESSSLSAVTSPQQYERGWVGLALPTWNVNRVVPSGGATTGESLGFSTRGNLTINGRSCGVATGVAHFVARIKIQGRIEPMLVLPDLQPPIDCAAQQKGCA